MAEPSLFRIAFTICRRELRSGLSGFGVFFTSLFLGVFSIAVVGSFTASARLGLLADAAALLGGDVEVRLAHQQLTVEQVQFLQSLGEVSQVADMRTMAFADTDVATGGGKGRGLVELKAVDNLYPLYGDMVLEPEQSFQASLKDGVLVEHSLLLRLGVEIGDSLRLGEASFPILGVLKKEPDRVVSAFSLGPRVMISLAGLARTGLVQPGSLVHYEYRLKIPTEIDADEVKTAIRTEYPQAGWRVRTWREAAPRIKRFLDRMSTNLTLLGLCSLLVGGLGVAGAVRGYLDGKMLNIAAMKCVGASGRTIFLAYLLQVLLLGGAASGCGLALAAALPFVVERVAGSQLPIPFQPAIFPLILVTAALFGLLIALLFSLKPLTRASQIPPSILFRGYAGSEQLKSGGRLRFATAFIASLLALLTVAFSADNRMALWFAAGATACFLLFRLLTALVIRMASYLPKPKDVRLSLGMRNIYRRGAPARSVMFSLGLGLTSLVLISQVQVNLTALVDREIPRDAPAFFLLDIQPDQVAPFEALVAASDAIEKSKRFPTLRGRITAIKGIETERAKIDPSVEWAVRGDRFLSYSEEMPDGTEIVAGSWWPKERSTEDELVSITADLAKGFGVTVGDSISVNLLGREVTATIASIREVDWSDMQLNFALLFAPGILQSAPQTHIAAIHVPIEHEEEVFRQVTDRFTNVSVIGVREVLLNVSSTLARLGTAFNAMAGVALFVSLLVLAGALSADQHRRIHDSVMFKVCGATRVDIILSFAFEFLLLGLCSGIIATLAGSLAAWAVLTRLMDSSFVLYPQVVLLTLGVAILLTMVLGLAGTWKALGHRPSTYLRELST